MILISHRGNINGKRLKLENTEPYVREALSKGYDVEIDTWFHEEEWYLGHDRPEHKTTIQFLSTKGLWIHCKNIEAIVQMRSQAPALNFFFHTTEDVVLTSKGYLWAFPGKQPIAGSISVMPEYNNDDLSVCIGICSDHIGEHNE